MAEQKPLGYALLGCGAFGQFCLEQYRTLPEVKVVAVADRTADICAPVAEKYGVEAYADLDSMLKRDDIDLVHIATPPGVHRETVMAALQAGKHVLCEKPLAVTLDDARVMLSAAKKYNRVLVVNLIMRYNPLCQIVGRIIRENALGLPVHGSFENDAVDERLSRDHWFWNRNIGGGIFIEHGVHFFDLYSTWLGGGEILAAAQLSRTGEPRMIDQVDCIGRYGDNVMASFYHGFHRAGRLERQEFRVACEQGDIRLFEWLPTSLRIEAALTEETAQRLGSYFRSARVTRTEPYSGNARKMMSRHRPFEADGKYLITADAGMTKGDLYGHVLRELMLDQVRYIRNPSHHRLLEEEAGLKSLEMAVRATELAAKPVSGND